jgi:tRNA (adenine57-N1/adenine58-N1)-methyltransferase
MHAHPGYPTTPRRVAPGGPPPRRPRRPAKGSTDEEGALESGLAFGAESDFTAEEMGERIPSDKKIRRLRRSVTQTSPTAE